MLFGAIGVMFLIFAVLQVSRSHFGVAIFLAAFGLLAVVGSITLSERALHRAGLFFILVNVVAAAIAVVSGIPQ
jgi:hypothetical protein